MDINNTKEKIIKFLKKTHGAGFKNIQQYLNMNASGIFRHLKTLQEEDIIYKIGKPPKVQYYINIKNMENKLKIFVSGMNWALSGDKNLINEQQFCQTRDVFDARYYRLFKELKKLVSDDNLISLIMAAVGEVGNNSFDHNLGRWRDVPGVFFALDEINHVIILSDRGQGVQNTLKQAVPDITNDTEALKIAFTEMVSGRAPERRGNGLKLVKKVVEENQLYLEFYSGEAVAKISGKGMIIEKFDLVIPGTFIYIKF